MENGDRKRKCVSLEEESDRSKNSPSQFEKKMKCEEKYEIVRSIGGDCMEEDELRNLLTNNPQPVCYYDGFAPSRTGRMHISQGVLKAMNVKKLTSAGCKVKIWIADQYAQRNGKMGGDLNKIQDVARYFIEIWKSLGMMDLDGSGQVEFLWSSREINESPHEPLFMDLRRDTEPKLVRCSQIMGCSEQDDPLTAQIFYPCLQWADIFFLKEDICRLGMAQCEANVHAGETCNDIKRKNKPIILSHRMLPGLRKGLEQMTRFVSCSSIYMDDEENEVNEKIKRAYCPPRVQGNPCLEYIKYLISPWFNEFKVERSYTNGESKIYKNFEEVVVDYESKDLHFVDLKLALSKSINTILQPVRNHFVEDSKAKDLLQQVKAYRGHRPR